MKTKTEKTRSETKKIEQKKSNSTSVSILQKP
jgi:hypothetical protein